MPSDPSRLFFLLADGAFPMSLRQFVSAQVFRDKRVAPRAVRFVNSYICEGTGSQQALMFSTANSEQVHRIATRSISADVMNVESLRYLAAEKFVTDSMHMPHANMTAHIDMQVPVSLGRKISAKDPALCLTIENYFRAESLGDSKACVLSHPLNMWPSGVLSNTRPMTSTLKA